MFFVWFIAINKQFDWLKLKIECRIQVDCENFEIERIKFNWICDENDFELIEN